MVILNIIIHIISQIKNNLTFLQSILSIIPTIGSDYGNTQYTTVTLKDNTVDQYDLMYASLLNQSKKSSVLVFEFHHLLTQITINIIKIQESL